MCYSAIVFIVGITPYLLNVFITGCSTGGKTDKNLRRSLYSTHPFIETRDVCPIYYALESLYWRF